MSISEQVQKLKLKAENLKLAKAYSMAKILNEAADTIEKMRKPGHWVHKVDNSAGKIFEYYECSECGRGILNYKTEFCCHCGADMRGDTECRS